jgi:DNA polymerase III epsilon subunit-like protein
MTSLIEQNPFPYLHLLAQKAGRPITIFDFETTGLLQDEDLGITEVGLLTIRTDGTVERWSSLVNPEYDIPEHVQQLTGINNQMVQSAPTWTEVWKRVEEAFTNHAMFGFNSNRFDVLVLMRQFQRYDMPDIEGRFYDVRVWHQILTQAGLKGKLIDVAKEWNVDIPLNLHRAPADVEVTARIMNKMLEERGNKELKDPRIKYCQSTPALIKPEPPKHSAASGYLLEQRRSASDLFAWLTTEMGLNGYKPLIEWAEKLDISAQHLEELMETAIDTKSLNANDFRHEPTQKWLQAKKRLPKLVEQVYPSLQDKGKLHYPFQALNMQLAQEKPKNVILDFIQLRIAMIDLKQPYVTRRGLLEQVFHDIKVPASTPPGQGSLFQEVEPTKKIPRPRFS